MDVQVVGIKQQAPQAICVHDFTEYILAVQMQMRSRQVNHCPQTVPVTAGICFLALCVAQATDWGNPRLPQKVHRSLGKFYFVLVSAHIATTTLEHTLFPHTLQPATGPSIVHAIGTPLSGKMQVSTKGKKSLTWHTHTHTKRNIKKLIKTSWNTYVASDHPKHGALPPHTSISFNNQDALNASI